MMLHRKCVQPFLSVLIGLESRPLPQANTLSLSLSLWGSKPDPRHASSFT